jgi:hypothetical protein
MQLLESGLSDASIAAWVKKGLLGPPDARARYAVTPATQAALLRLPRSL